MTSYAKRRSYDEVLINHLHLHPTKPYLFAATYTAELDMWQALNLLHLIVSTSDLISHHHGFPCFKIVAWR